MYFVSNDENKAVQSIFNVKSALGTRHLYAYVA